MALCHNCDDTRIEYIGNGSQVDYTFPFEYYKKSDVSVANWNERLHVWEDFPQDIGPTSQWNFLNETTIRFNAPPSDGQKFIIYRCTDLSPLPAEFYPGTAIKAQDLNDNFFVLASAVEEAKCGVQRLEETLDERYWDKGEETITREEQINDPSALVDDDHIFSAGAIAQRSDIYSQDEKPEELPYEQPGKEWYDTETLETYIWDSNAGAWIDMGNAGPPGRQGPFGPPGHVIISDSPPVEYPAQGEDGPRLLESGDLWFDSYHAMLFVYYIDNASAQWVSISKTGPQGPPNLNGDIQDAPEDGLTYGRKDGAWNAVSSGVDDLTFVAPLKRELNDIIFDWNGMQVIT